jgi:hypothetical protein
MFAGCSSPWLTPAQVRLADIFDPVEIYGITEGRPKKGWVSRILSEREVIRFPAKIAVVKIVKGSRGIYNAVSLSTEELKRFSDVFKGDRRISSVETLSSFFMTSHLDLTNLYLSAAKIGASLVYLYTVEITTASGWNSISNLNLLIFPLLFLPGKTVKASVAMEGVLLDVKTGTAYIVATSYEEAAQDIHNLSSITKAQESLVQRLELKALESLANDLATRLALLH